MFWFSLTLDFPPIVARRLGRGCSSAVWKTRRVFIARDPLADLGVSTDPDCLDEIGVDGFVSGLNRLFGVNPGTFLLGVLVEDGVRDDARKGVEKGLAGMAEER